MGILQHPIAQVVDSPMAIDDDVSHFRSLPSEELDAQHTDHETAHEGEPTGTADSDDPMDAEEEAPDTAIKKQPKKKQKKGLAVRDRINAAATELSLNEKKRKNVLETGARCV
jgi:hypothetical protein